MSVAHGEVECGGVEWSGVGCAGMRVERRDRGEGRGDGAPKFYTARQGFTGVFPFYGTPQSPSGANGASGQQAPLAARAGGTSDNAKGTQRHLFGQQSARHVSTELESRPSAQAARSDVQQVGSRLAYLYGVPSFEPKSKTPTRAEPHGETPGRSTAQMIHLHHTSIF